MAKDANKTAQDGSKTAQDGLTTAQDLQEGSKRPPRRPKRAQDDSRGLQEDPREGPNKHKSLLALTCLIDFGVIPFPSFRQLKTAQEASKIDLRQRKKPTE